MKSFSTNIADIEIDGDTVYAKIKDGINIEKKDIEVINKKIVDYNGGKKFISIIEFENITIGHVSSEAFSHQANSGNFHYSIADAYVVKSFGIKLLMNFYLRTFKPKVPTRIFGTRKKAIQWAVSVQEKELAIQ